MIVSVMSFVLPLLIWSLVSYVPWIWHPMTEITEPGSVSYFKQGMLVDNETFERESLAASEAGTPLPAGNPANPIYLPAPQAALRIELFCEK